MEFTKQFTEAAQNAILRKIEADQWESLPWLAKLVQQNIREAFAPTISRDRNPLEAFNLDDCNPLPEDFLSKKSEPVDICGCPFGKCTCQTLEKTAKDYGIEPSVLKTMAESESCENKQPIGGSVTTYDNPGDSFESNDFTHVDGYDWRIIVADRSKNHANSWAEHFNYRPTQEEFENQFRHFHARTHHVHVNQWVDGDWITITGNYVPHWNKEKPVETFTATEEWPSMKTHRIKFWDQRIGAYNYVYFDRHPGGIVMAKYHSAKCYAVVQKRPEGV